MTCEGCLGSCWVLCCSTVVWHHDHETACTCTCRNGTSNVNQYWVIVMSSLLLLPSQQCNASKWNKMKWNASRTFILFYNIVIILFNFDFTFIPSWASTCCYCRQSFAVCYCSQSSSLSSSKINMSMEKWYILLIVMEEIRCNQDNRRSVTVTSNKLIL